MKRQLTVIGAVWDFWPVLRMCNKLFESKFISFYNPWLKQEMDRSTIILFNEKTKNRLLWPFKLIRRTAKILKIMREFRPDIVITHHDDASISVLPVLFITRLRGKKVRFVAFVRAGADTFSTREFYWRMIAFMIKHFYQYFDAVLTPSKGNKRELQRMFGLRNVHHLYNCIDIEKYRQNANELLAPTYATIFNDSFVFTNIGRLTEQKGQWHLIRVFSVVAAREPDAVLVIIGEGELKDQLCDLARRCGVGKRVYFLGKQENVLPFLKASGCSVSTSLWESFGNVIVESLVTNTPIISTDCPSGPREILCPDLTIDVKIKYPYLGRHGILIKVFSAGVHFATPSELPLSDEEKMLATIMLHLKRSRRLQKKYGKGVLRAKELDINNPVVIKAWKGALTA
jgi:glycosyltransferase involved in cell wall biosynthesis